VTDYVGDMGATFNMFLQVLLQIFCVVLFDFESEPNPVHKNALDFHTLILYISIYRYVNRDPDPVYKFENISERRITNFTK
jgi:hypothetical protein